jgi:hypothetical protein
LLVLIPEFPALPPHFGVYSFKRSRELHNGYSGEAETQQLTFGFAEENRASSDSSSQFL